MIERVPLFPTVKSFIFALLVFTLLASISLLIEYINYRDFNRFDSVLVEAKVLNHYTKTKQTKTGKTKTYDVLKLKTTHGVTLYTISYKHYDNLIGKTLKAELFLKDGITFREYLSGFFAISKIQSISSNNGLYTTIDTFLQHTHKDSNAQAIYEALYLAKPLPKKLQQHFSTLGISHLIAISGFHLGVLSFVLFMLFRIPYKFLQNRYFPYRSYTRDMFILTASLLLAYTLFLGAPPSLLRAFVMLVVGFYLYDRGIQIISMQTLLLTVLLILALFPRLFFAIGFWLSVAGVFYIFLFMLYYKHRSKVWQFFALPVFVYVMMLPYSLAIFGNFSLWHPFSIVLTILFTLFYPLSILLHIIGFGDILDGVLHALLTLAQTTATIQLPSGFLIGFVILSITAVWSRLLFLFLQVCSVLLFIYTIYQVA